MNLRYILLCCLLPCLPATGQTLYTYGGAGIAGDAFLRDKAITKYKKPWPVELGIQGVTGLRYQTGQSFDALLDVSIGFVSIGVPLPEQHKEKLRYDLIQFMVMAGSGVHITADEQHAIMPFIQIGAGYFDYSGYSTSGAIDVGAQPSWQYDQNTGRWLPLIGGGIDWQFRLYMPASFNLRFVYTPLSFFQEPLPYGFSTRNQTEELLLQGKLLQTMLTFRVFLRVAKWEERYS